MLDTNSEDAISLLPEEVLGKILSLIPTKQAASTSVLSEKWRNLFTLVHNNDFDDSDLLRPEEGKEERDVVRESFRNFVDRTLALQCGSPIKKFSLKCHLHLDSEMSYVGPWISNAVGRGVLELDLSIHTRYKFVQDSETGCSRWPQGMKRRGDVFLPSELFTCKTLVTLRLGKHIFLGEFPLELSLPALKSLFIDSICFAYKDLSDVFFPGCPVLEELVLRYEDYVMWPSY
ncbi:F-box/LRR-repeat protein At3g60040-like [Capsella rubella]|uniref:F-box/LRR-repeat protein At3g60040-like n=1 Tax=Capsella rubella TaxID=81985 RepID=UPI000CD585B9|nr:F-box/LRR-repeat protein At3g60040-like [Capsella rubella]